MPDEKVMWAVQIVKPQRHTIVKMFPDPDSAAAWARGHAEDYRWPLQVQAIMVDTIGQPLWEGGY